MASNVLLNGNDSMEGLDAQAQTSYISFSSEHTSDYEEEAEVSTKLIQRATWASEIKNELPCTPFEDNEDFLLEMFNNVTTNDCAMVSSKGAVKTACKEALKFAVEKKIHGMESIIRMDQEEKLILEKIEKEKEKNEQLRRQCGDLKKQLSAAQKTFQSDVKNAKTKLAESLRDFSNLKGVEKVWEERTGIQAALYKSVSMKEKELKDWYKRHDINITFKDETNDSSRPNSQAATLIKMSNVFPNQKDLEVCIKFSSFSTIKNEFKVEGVTPDFEKSEEVIQEANETQNLPKFLMDCKNFLKEEYTDYQSATGFNRSSLQRTNVLFGSPEGL